MIWTLILSFNSSVWLHLTLYIAWEQSNIPQHSSTSACWDTLHLPAAVQGAKGWTKAKKSNSPTFSLLHLWVTIFNIPGGAASGAEVTKQAPFIPKWFPRQPKFQLGHLGLEFGEGRRICFAFLEEPGDTGWFLGISKIPLSQSISYSCLWSPDQATLWGNSWSED